MLLIWPRLLTSFHQHVLIMLNHVVFNVLKNPNPLKDDEASALLVAAVLALVLFWGSSML